MEKKQGCILPQVPFKFNLSALIGLSSHLGNLFRLIIWFNV